MSNIVVATDFRAQADRAIDRAVMLGKERGWQVFLVHALDPRRRAPARAELDALMREVLPEDAGEVVFAYPEDRAPEAIAAYAAEIGAALVVVGPARFNAIGDYVLGTATDYVVRHCTCPVLVVKRRPHRPYQRIVVATDFSQPSRHALERAAELFPEGELMLAHAYHVPFEGWQRAAYVKDQVREAEQTVCDEFVAELAPALRARLSTHMVYGTPHKAIGDFVTQQRADLLVLGTHGTSGFRQATIGSMANTLLETSPIDTLVIGKGC